MKKFTVTENDTLSKFTDFYYPQGSFVLGALLKARDVKVNGVRVSSDVKLSAGDEVIYYTSVKQESALTHYTVYEDENIVVCDKFSGVSSEGLCRELCGGEYFAVHRLDRNTQGIIIFAKTREAERCLLAAFKSRTLEKTYLALCMDGFVRDVAVLKGYLKKDAKSSFVTVSDRETDGAEIVTEYRVLKRFDGLALVEIKPHTGKTHQIRAHMAHIGCPVLGDEKYGDAVLNQKYAARRQRLVAKRLTLRTAGALGYLDGKCFESSFFPEV